MGFQVVEAFASCLWLKAAMSAANRFVTPPPRTTAFWTTPPPHEHENEVASHFKEVVGEDCVPELPLRNPASARRSFAVLRRMFMTSWPVPRRGHAALVSNIEKLVSKLNPNSPVAPRATPQELEIVGLAVALVQRCQWQRPGQVSRNFVTMLNGARDGDAEPLTALLKVLRDMDLTPSVSIYKVSNALTGQTIQVELPQGASGSFLREVLTQRIRSQDPAEDLDAAQIHCHVVRLFVGQNELDYAKPAPSEINIVLVQARSNDRFAKFVQDLASMNLV